MNILLSQEGIVKICDFGMSKTLGEIEDDQGGNADQVMGTPQWLAPEVADGEPYTKAADVYSFGIVLWEIGSRRLPYSTTPKVEDMSPPALMAEVAKGVRPSLQSLQLSATPQVGDRYVLLMVFFHLLFCVFVSCVWCVVSQKNLILVDKVLGAGA